MSVTIATFSDSRAFKLAAKELHANSIVQMNFGASPEFSFAYINGFKISNSGVTGDANFVIEIVGNGKSGLAYVAMFKSAGLWKIEELNLMLEDEELIALMVK